MASLHNEVMPTEELGPFRPDFIDFASIPGALITRAQWVPWRWGDRPRRRDARRKKIPYNPHTGKRAKSNDPTTWGTFAEARDVYVHQDYDGVGFMLTKGDQFVVIDLDDIRDTASGAISAEILTQVNAFDTYTEFSPSGTGLHLWLQFPANLPPSRKTPIEVYSANQFMTVTGQRLPYGSAAIEERQETFEDWRHRTCTTSGTSPRRTWSIGPVPFSHPGPLTDLEVLEKARQAKNGAAFSRLWDGDWRAHPSQSEADLALVGWLARYTRDAAQIDQLFRQSPLCRPKWDTRHGSSTYGERTIALALQSAQPTAHSTSSHTQPSSPASSRTRQEQRMPHVHPWQQRSETPEERIAYLRRMADEAKDLVRAHLVARGVVPLVIALPPGVGKTRVIAELGAELDLAWLAARHDMHSEVAKGAPYRHILPAKSTCPDATRLVQLAAWGYTVWPIHKRHHCPYDKQFEETGSAFYIDLLAPSTHPVRHQGGIIDELEMAAWLPELPVSLADMDRARNDARWSEPRHHAVAALLQGIHDAMSATHMQPVTLTAKALFDLLDRHMHGRLADLVKQVADLDVATVSRPRVTDDESARQAERRGKVILPTLVQVLREDLPKWASGRDWNSRMRLDALGTVHIIEPRRFHPAPAPWPFAILDATANATLLSLLYGASVHVERREVDPPPHMRHLAVRIPTKTGLVTRYSKSTLVDGTHAARSRERVIRDLTALLERENPDGRLSVGLITYEGCEQALGEALGIPPERRGHFWGVRGTNTYEDCDILIVVGTPTINVETIVWMARALYAADPAPIDPTYIKHDGRYVDARLAQLAESLMNAEVTQAAHRSRPLRHDHRVVITLTAGEVDYLPITETISAFAHRPTTKQRDRQARVTQAREADFERAYQAIRARGEQVTVRRLLGEAGGQTAAAAEWLRRRKAEEAFPESA